MAASTSSWDASAESTCRVGGARGGGPAQADMSEKVSVPTEIRRKLAPLIEQSRPIRARAQLQFMAAIINDEHVQEADGVHSNEQQAI